MDISLDSIIGILGLVFGSGALGGIFTWRWQRVRARAEAKEKEAEAKSAEVDMAQKVQDTYQQILDDKQNEVDDNHRLISELREDRDHYKQGYIEFRDQLDKLQKEFRDFRNETEDERVSMKRDIARNGRQVAALRPFLCANLGCKLRQPVVISADGEVDEGGKVSGEDADEDDAMEIEPLNQKEL